MDFFSRKRPFLLVEERPTEDLTRRVFSNKLVQLKREYKLIIDDFGRRTRVDPHFLQCCIFHFDLAYKTLDVINSLTNGGDYCWKFLNLFRADVGSYIHGEPGRAMYALDVDISNNFSHFYFKLFVSGLISIRSYLKIIRSVNIANALGIGHLNDYHYYSSRSENLLSYRGMPQEKMVKLQEDYYASIGVIDLTLREFQFFSRFFIARLNSFPNVKQILDVLEHSRGQMSYFDKYKNNLDLDMWNAIIEMINSLNTPQELHRMFMEFQVFGKEEVQPIFNYFLLFFLNKGFRTGDQDEAITDFESLMRALSFMDMLSFSSTMKFSWGKFLTRTTDRSLRILCNYHLSVLMDREMINRVIPLNFSMVKILSGLIRNLYSGERFFSEYVGEYMPHLKSQQHLSYFFNQ